MNAKIIIGNILKVPLLLLVLASFIASIYAATNQSFGIDFGSTVLIGIVLVLYAIGIVLTMDWKKKEKEVKKEEIK
jgi:pilus assembly protein TadC